MSNNPANTPDSFLSHLKSVFAVTIHDAQEIIGNFHREMRSGLAGMKSSLKMIPSYIGRPTGREKGEYLVLDLGGTNVRVMEVELDGKGNTALAAVNRFVIPQGLMSGTGDELFDFMADCIHLFFKENCLARQQTYDLAFTFSFPVEQLSLASGKLIGWTKGFTASGVVGRDVVGLLSEALQRKEMGFVQVAALANDTVGTLAAGSYADPCCDVGVILGTGTNACYPEMIARIPKCPELGGPTGEMIVNIEWGGFSRIKTNIYDQDLDRASHNSGKQQLEKMVSGMYLGEIVRRVIIDMMTEGLLFRGTGLSAFSTEYKLHTEHLSLVAQGADILEDFGLRNVSEDDKRTIGELCHIVSTRSARIAGTAIAAVVTWMDENIASNHTIAIDGTLFEKYPGYSEQVTRTLYELFGACARRIKLTLVRDGSGIGAAISAAVAASTRNVTVP